MRSRCLCAALALLAITACGGESGPGLDTSAPGATVRMVFIHHSTGSHWIASGTGNLGQALNDNNYYVTETDYGWNAETGDNLGGSTDTWNWPDWFNETKMPYVYANDENFDYTNAFTDPGGENEIIMFKSCFPNSEVGDSIDDEKAIYNGLLTYFAAHTDKLFVLIIPPPEITINSAPLTRELANWLADFEHGWLAGYTHRNVWAFDYYNVLTDPANHHRVEDGSIVHSVTGSPSREGHGDELYYYSGGDDHPTAAGHRKATAEFVPMLNAFYHLWKND